MERPLLDALQPFSRDKGSPSTSRGNPILQDRWTEQNEGDFADLRAKLPGPLSIYRNNQDVPDDAIRAGVQSPVYVDRKAVCLDASKGEELNATGLVPAAKLQHPLTVAPPAAPDPTNREWS
jgi:hypothetical protein